MTKTTAPDGTVVETEERQDGTVLIRITPPTEALRAAIQRDQDRRVFTRIA